MILKAPWQWVASPLGFNMLLPMLKENSPTVEKYTKIAKTIDNTEGCKLKNRIFVSAAKDTSQLREFADVEKVDFSKNENSFTVYVNKYGDLKQNEFSCKTEFIYANICTFESRWQLNKHSSVAIKLYNSFNYVDDVRYEGRLMELPLRTEKFKLVLVLPNEGDLLVNSLFAKLTNQGLAAAIGSIQPLFTATTALTMPMSINVKSRVQVKEVSAISNGVAIQYGNIAISDIGTSVKVLTCLYLPADMAVNNVDHVPLKARAPPFYFAIVYQDTPIFYGDFKSRIGAQNI